MPMKEKATINIVKCPKTINFRTNNFLWWLVWSGVTKTKFRLNRAIEMGKYKHGKPDAELTTEEIKVQIESKRPKLRHRAYVWLLYWIGCRRHEPLVIYKKDIEEKEGSLFITITVNPEIPFSRGKHGLAGGAVELPLQLEGVEDIRQAWIKTRNGKRVFPFTGKTGYRIIKRLFPHKSPHWLRHNRITKLRKQIDGENVTLDDVKSFTGIRRDSTIQHYGMKTKAGIKRVSKVLEWQGAPRNAPKRQAFFLNYTAAIPHNRGTCTKSLPNNSIC